MDDNLRSNRPRNLQGLLNFCTRLTSSEDGTHHSDFSQIDPERLQFLQNALQEVMINFVQKMAECLSVIASDAIMDIDDNVGDQINALESLEEYIDDIDNANDLYKIGGFDILKACLESPHSGIRRRAASLFGDACQNNPFAQEKMLELNVLPALLKITDSDSSEQCRIKGLYAVSCLIRECEAGEAEFVKCDGFSVLMRAIQANIAKLVVKAAFLLMNLVSSSNRHCDTVLDMGFIDQLVSVLRDDTCENITREHCICAILALARSDHRLFSESLKINLGLVPYLRSHIAEIDGKEEFKEEAHFTQEYLEMLPLEDDTDAVR